RAQVGSVDLAGDRDRPRIAALLGISVHLVDVRDAFEALDGDLADVAHGEVGVERSLERHRRGSSVENAQLHRQRPADRDGEGRGEIVNEERSGVRIRRELERGPHASSDVAGHRAQLPREEPSHTVRRGARDAGLRTEPWETNRHAAPDGLSGGATLELALRTHPENGTLALRLE